VYLDRYILDIIYTLDFLYHRLFLHKQS
jgi:hypothetical protein